MTRRQRGRWRRVTASSAVAIVLAATGCRAPDDSVSTRADADAQPSAIAESERLLDEVVDGVWGTAGQRDAVTYLEHVAFQSLIVECMADQGFVYIAPPASVVPSPVTRIGDGVLDPVDPATVAADPLGTTGTVDGLVAAVRAGDPRPGGDPDGPRIPEHEVPGWGAASDRCAPDESDVAAQVDRPSSSRGEGAAALVRDVVDGEAVREAMAGYPACMQDAGHPVDAERDGGPRRDLVWRMLDRFEELLYDAERTRSLDEVIASAEWRRLESTRAAAASADATCRTAAHDLAFTELLEPLRRFATEHRADIDRLRAEWAAIERRAEQTPDPGRP